MGRIKTWWLLAEQVCARLTAPKTDIAQADDEVEDILCRSWLWSRAELLAWRIHAAWLESRCRRIASRVWR